MSRRIRADVGQSTVEAAVLLPTLMLLMALLVQPICVFYTLSVMRHAAAETARVLATASDESVAQSFALRRLAAVPDSSLFHVGGRKDWRVSVERGEGEVAVAIRGHVRPLPFLGVVVASMGLQDANGVLLESRLRERMRPEWLQGDYEDWMRMWQD